MQNCMLHSTGLRLSMADETNLEAKKLRALELYLGGLSVRQIAHQVSSEFDDPVSAASIQYWSTSADPQWSVIKMNTKANAIELLSTRKSTEMAVRDAEHLTIYEEIRKKAREELEMNIFDKAGDAVTAIDKAIKGERTILAGLIQKEFLQDVIEILKQEIQDDEALTRIAMRFRELTTKTYAQ
jgi:hypothetical protein